MVNMLLRLVRVVPANLLLEPSGLLVVFDAPNIGADDAFQGVEHGAIAKTIDRIAPIRPRAQIDGVVIAIREPEPQQDTSGRLDPQRVDELLSHEAHRRRTEDHHALLVQPDDSLVRPEVEQFGEVKIVAVGRLVA